MKKCYGLALLGLVVGLGAGAVFAAERATFDPMRAALEMRKNIAWTVEGLYQLGKSKDRTLHLTAAQTKKILPLYRELIAKKIIVLQLEKDQGKKRRGPAPDRSGGPPNAEPGDSQQHQARMQERAALVGFGNAKMEAINRILSKKQVAFIDNWNFKAEKYGFPNFVNRTGAKHHGGKGQFDGAPPAGGQPGYHRSGTTDRRRPVRGQRPPMDSRINAGRKLLIKLYQDVLKMLQKSK
jgi:hypothetical protein